MNQDEILAQFNKWWNEDDDIPNDAPWQQDSMIQFAWAGYNAAIQHYKDSVLKECGAPVAYYDPDLDNGSKGVSFDPLSGGIPLFTSVQLIAARKGMEEEIEDRQRFFDIEYGDLKDSYGELRQQLKAAQEEIEQLKDEQFKRLEREAEKRMKLREQLITAEQRVAELEGEVAHWKNNHETEVRRARILKERTDMPIERVQAYEKWGLDQVRIAELEDENERLKEENNQLEDDCGYQMQWKREFNEQLEYCKGQLAASQLREKQLRELIKRAHEFVRDGLCNDGLSSLMEALALPTDTSALDAYVAEKVKEAMK